MKNLPEKIYATPNFDRRWQTKAIDDESKEYVRKDVFIEKALKFLDEYFFFNNRRYSIESEVFDSKKEMIENFKNYIEGE